MGPPPRWGAAQLWGVVLLAALSAWQLLRLLPALLPTLPQPPPSTERLLQRRDGRRVVLLAQPRTGGDALCRLAAYNGEAVACSPPPQPELSATQQCEALRTLPATFVRLSAVPHTLDASSAYAAVMREPKAQLLSQLLQLQRLAQRHLDGEGAWPPELAALGLGASAGPPSLAALLRAVATAGPSAPESLWEDAAVRFYGGEAARRAQPGWLSEVHLAAALRTLAAMDAVLVTERLQASAPALAELAGWRFWDVTRKDRRRGDTVRDAGAAALSRLTAEQLALVVSRTASDSALYEAAVARFGGWQRGERRVSARFSGDCSELEGG